MKKQFAVDYQAVLDYNGTVSLQTEEFVTETSYDALNRPVTITNPDSTVITNVYNKGGLLEQVLNGELEYISNINYNARGQRTEVIYGNNSKTRYTYDDENFRLVNLLTTRNNGADKLQDLTYLYDAVGNIVQITNATEDEHYFNNTVVSATSTYEYDALYRLTEAAGRELTSLQLPSATDFVNNIPVPNTDTNAMQNYTQRFAYDKLGNILQMRSVNQWTRDYYYDTATNRLLKHDEQGQSVYTYDAHGNMLTMPHLTSMDWDYKDELVSAGNGTVTSFYNYDVQGSRSRKVVVKPGGIREERYYAGGYEVYRKYISNTLDKERETIHVADDRDRFAIIDTLTVENGVTLSTPVEIVRYQYSNHLGSSCLELDASANIISYEEYHPFGTTSYRSGRNEVDVSLKRYKYVGKERDEETGLYYYGARYYAAWIARFVSVDPLASERSWVSPYSYCQNNPVGRVDPSGALDNPIYDWGGNFLGTDDKGLQGDAIIMSKSNFAQGMSNSDAMAKGRTLNNMGMAQAMKFANNGKFNSFLNHYNSLSSRPDYDGVMSYNDLLAWGREMGNSPVFLDASKIDIGDVYIDDFEGVGKGMSVNTTMKGAPLDTYGPWGKNYMRLMSANGSVKMSKDRFDYDYHNLGDAWDEGIGTFLYETIIRSPSIFTLRQYHSIDGSFGFDMYPYGYTKAKVRVPYTGPGSGEHLLKSMDWRTYQ